VSEPIARLIDHALLHPTMTDEQIRGGCELAKKLDLKSVCVKPYSIPLAVEILRGSNTFVGTVIGFPHGSHPTEIKVTEAQWALDHGAVELDMVINIGKAMQGDWDFVRQDIAAIVAVARNQNAIVKVIFETDYFTDKSIIAKLCRVSEEAGADFVKTSTGFGFVKQANGDYNYVGATVEDIELMRKSCTIGVKASGGVRDFAQSEALRKAGATRLGTSASEAIVKGQGTDSSGY
jgi:deoxyribose-phosphate aldolase